MVNFNLYNNPFDNFTQRTYQPQTMQNRLQTAYNQALKGRTPDWAIQLSNAMTPLAEIIALNSTKGAFNQGRIAESLERQKDRQIAYNQALQDREDSRANDYVQMAKDQLGIDMALDDRERARLDAQLNRDEKLEQQKRAYEQYLAEQEAKAKQQEFENHLKVLANNRDQDLLDFNKRKQDDINFQQEKENAFKDRQLKLQEQQLAQQKEQAEEKAIEEELKKNQERAFSMIKDNSVTPALGNLLLQHPELMPYLKDSGKFEKPHNMFGILPWKTGGDDNKFDFNYEQYLIDNGIPVTKDNIKELKKQLGL